MSGEHGKLGLVADGARAQQAVELDGEGHQPRDARNAAATPANVPM